MGTRSTVKFYSEGRCVLSLYNQYDGYYSGVGKELVDFFEDKNNMGNGIQDTALLYVCYKKEGKPYHTYATTENDIQEYNYSIYEYKGKLIFEISRERWSEEFNDIVVVKTLRLGTFEEFKEEIAKDL